MKVAHGSTLIEVTQEEKELLAALVGGLSGPTRTGSGGWGMQIIWEDSESHKAEATRRLTNDLYNSLTRTEALCR